MNLNSGKKEAKKIQDIIALSRWHQYYSPDDPTRRKPVDVRDLLEGHSVVSVLERTLRPSNRSVQTAIVGVVRWVGVVHHNQLVGLEIYSKRHGTNTGTYEGVTYFSVHPNHNAIFIDPKHLIWPSAEDTMPIMAAFVMRNIVSQPRPAWIYLSWKYRVRMITVMLRVQRALARITRPCVFVWGQNRFGELSLENRNPSVRFPELLREPKGVAKRIATICPSYQHSVVLTTSGAVYTAGSPLTNLLGHSYKVQYFRPVSVLDPNESHKSLYDDVSTLRAFLGGPNHDDFDEEEGPDATNTDKKPRFDAWSPVATPQRVEQDSSKSGSRDNSAFKFPSLYSPARPRPSTSTTGARQYRTGTMKKDTTTSSRAASNASGAAGGRNIMASPASSVVRPSAASVAPNGSITGNSLPRIKFKSDRVLTVAAGGMHTVAMLESGRVVTWGGRLYGKLGTRDASADEEGTLQVSNGGEANEPNDLASNSEMSGIWSGVPGVPAKRRKATEALLALLSDDPEGRTAGVIEHISSDKGSAEGDTPNIQGFSLRYALPGLDSSKGIPQGFNIVTLKAGKQACSVACGQTFTVICTTDGELYTFGGSKDHSYVLGHGPNSYPVSTPTKVDTRGHHIIQVVCGELHTLALTRDRRVMAWGKNDFGQLGLGRFTNVHTPELITAAYEDGDRYGCIPSGSGSLQHREVLQIAAGGQHSMLVVLHPGERYIPELDVTIERSSRRRGSMEQLLDLRQSGELYTFGSGVNGQLGHGHTAALGLPGLALDDGGAMGGSNMNEGDGLPYDGVLKSSACPRRVTGISEAVVQAAAGLMHSLCLTKTGRVYSWGSGAHGQLGDGQFNAVNRPVWVSALRHVRVAHIAAGGNHSAASTRPFRNMMQMRETYRLSEKRIARRLSQDLGVADALLSDADKAKLLRQNEYDASHREQKSQAWDSDDEFDDLSDSDNENGAYYEGVDVDADEGNEYTDDLEESDPDSEDSDADRRAEAENRARLQREQAKRRLNDGDPDEASDLIDYQSSLASVYGILSQFGDTGNDGDLEEGGPSFVGRMTIPNLLPPSSLFKSALDVEKFTKDVLKLDISITHTSISATIQRIATFQTFQPVQSIQDAIAKFSRRFASDFQMMADNVTFRPGCVTATLSAAVSAGKPLASSNMDSGAGGVVLNGIRGLNAGPANEQTRVTSSDLAKLGLSSKDANRLRKMGVGSAEDDSSSQGSSSEAISSKGLTQCTYLSTCRIRAETRSALSALLELQKSGKQLDESALPTSVLEELAFVKSQTAVWSYEFYRNVVQPARNSAEDTSKIPPQTAGLKVPIWQRISVCEIRPLHLRNIESGSMSKTTSSQVEEEGGEGEAEEVDEEESLPKTEDHQSASKEMTMRTTVNKYSLDSSSLGDLGVPISIESKQIPKMLQIGDEELAECLYLTPSAAEAAARSKQSFSD